MIVYYRVKFQLFIASGLKDRLLFIKHPQIFAYIYHHVKIATFISRFVFQKHPNKSFVD